MEDKERAFIRGGWCVVVGYYVLVFCTYLLISKVGCMCVLRIACLCTSMYTPSTCFILDPSVRLWLSDNNYIAHQCKTASPSLPVTQGTVHFLRNILKRVESGCVAYMKTLDRPLDSLLMALQESS